MRTTLLLSLFFLYLAASADKAVNENPVTFKVHFESPDIEIGGQENLVIEMTVAPEHHAYKDMIDLQWEGGDPFTLDPFQVKPTFKFEDPATKTMREGVEGTATIVALAHIPKNISPGNHEGRIALKYQACSKTYCLFPKTIHLPVSFVAALSAGGTLSKKSGATSGFQKMWSIITSLVFRVVGGHHQ
jgi:cytochrome c biogenesis DsbD-like protein